MLDYNFHTRQRFKQRPSILWRPRDRRANQREYVLKLSECKHLTAMSHFGPIVLPWPLQNSLEAATRALLQPGDRSYTDFSRPAGEAALVSPDSVSWRVFKNPLSLFIGGVTAVIMELAGRS